ncbi:ATP-grasp domain-containing protein [Streptomyces bikiniensis]|uniref:ATP-grasp domain-containing protein n=1 Tax=Streptomyces bikiniensis TaxID=1896 RepID=UPI0004BEA01F|nr:biotin carboxylase [Streptomyces bikiniensis]
MRDVRPHIVVLHRWRAAYAAYERYVDHGTHAVTYVTTDVGAEAVPESAAEVVVVPATDDLARVRKEVDGLAQRHGPPRSVIALKEDDLLVASHLAEEWDCRARRPDQVALFRDKSLMVDAVARAGLAVPATAPAPDAEAVRAFARDHGLPLIVKPTSGSSSEGVTLLRSAEDLDRLSFPEGARFLVQAHIPDAMYHVDGVFDGRDLLCWKSSRYLNDCLGFRAGNPVGSVEEDQPHIADATACFATRVLRALTRDPVPFHLELFVKERGTAAPECVFLEVGARVGGAEIPIVWRDVHGYDLMEAAFRIALGEPPPPYAPPAERERGGFLLVPAPAARPCVITAITPMTGRTPGPYAEDLLDVGDVLPDADAYYEHVGGRFRFRGRTSAEVRRAITETARAFRVSGRSQGGAR